MTVLIKPLSYMFVLATTLGVVMHDTQVDKATNIALNPVLYANISAREATAKSGDHVHVDRFSASNQGNSVRASLPKTPPRDEDRRYVQSKKSALSDGDTARIWPSA
jgi:hypothetical protein